MTSPAPQTSSQPNPDALQGQSPSEQQMILAVAAALSVGAAYEATVKRIVPILAPLRLPIAAIKTATRVAMSAPVGDDVPPGSRPNGSRATAARVERTFRATYLVAAAKRVARLLREGMPPMEIIAKERNAFRRHLEAQARRRLSARQVERMAVKHGTTLGWYAKMDERTSAECRWANGKNFDVARRPPIGYPGAVHPFCRCTAGPPHASGKTVYTQRKVASA